MIERAEVAGPDLQDFFSAAEARQDRWARLRALARRLALPTPPPEASARAAALLRDLEPLESYWAYPGAEATAALREALAQGRLRVFASRTERIARALLRGDYRHDPRAWALEGGEDEEGEDPQGEPPGDPRPYFEVLVVHDGLGRGEARRARERMRSLRRPEDPFIYELVHVPSFEDAVLGVVCNVNLQAVVIYDGFGRRSAFDLPVLRSQLVRHLPADEDAPPDSEGLGLPLARMVHRLRPELDTYLLTDQAVEHLAAGADAANLRRIFYDVEELLELHLSLLDGVGDRYDTPFFSTLKRYSRRPIGTFHALPVARGKSIFKSNWIRDMGRFYGPNLFLAESSATTGGLDSLLEPTGTIKAAQDKAARAFGARRAFFGTNGTSTSNKIVLQAILRPGDIVLIDRNCHKSHHYGLVLAGAQPVYLEAFPLHEYSMYGGVPLRSIKKALLDLEAAGKLDRVRLLDLTNCTFDGHMYHPRQVMEACLGIKPDLAFLWDEAWFAFARFSPFHRRRTAMAAAEALRARYADPAYRREYEQYRERARGLAPDDPARLDLHPLPDPDRVRIRVYATQSTHKSLSALRQGSMILVNDDDFGQTDELFREAFFTHTSTSPNQQILASLDLARRQAELEGYELVMKHTSLALRLRREINAHPLVSRYFRVLKPAEMIPAELRSGGLIDYGPPHSTWKEAVDALDEDEFALDPTRLTLLCGSAGFDGTAFKGLLADRYDIQINKTSRNTVLLMTNINNTRSDAAYLIKVLADVARDLDDRLRTADERLAFDARVRTLVRDVPALPDFSGFHPSFRPDPEGRTPEGDLRKAYFAAYDADACEHLKLDDPQTDERLRRGPPPVSASFVIPYPPGFPILVPGQTVSREIVGFLRTLDVKEVHGYSAAAGLKVLKVNGAEPSREEPGREKRKVRAQSGARHG